MTDPGSVEDRVSFVVSAGHDEYGPEEVEGLTIEDYTVEVLRATLSGDFEGEVPGWEDAVVEDSIVTHGDYDYDVQYESFKWWYGPTEAADAAFESLRRQVEAGPQGADDDTFDYWPSCVKYTQQVADELDKISPRDTVTRREHVDTTARAAIYATRPEFADELMDKCGVSED